jgi:hypothetical protein
VLARLATVLGLSYLRLLELAGYLDEQQLAEAACRTPKPHPIDRQDLSPDEWRAVGEFIQELKARRNQPAPRGHARKGGPGASR